MRSAVRVRAPRPETSCCFGLAHDAGVTQLVEFLPSKQAVAGSSPVSRSQMYIVSLQAGEKPPGGNQAALWQARGRCFYVPKGVQRHPASFCALPHQESDFAFVTKYHLCESFGIFNQAPTSRTALRQKDRKHRECVSRGRFLVRQPGEVHVISAEGSRTGHV